ncbi:glycoside hydrolase family 45 protein [Gonapodya prolifera JEL478]|uniref:Cellulase n=1 Tax=Gonapodya prolifera (strain JEL478) TaxID=1344416 RepID=A0A139AFQ8_GONPJ|nr:glycoside hydrolase family 45 protein [Gonapodya prolifera JEL478]|eukprot:KXS15255.1 glycoside hydrolase family 45 protein [Gonapodya prolifera JEL478]
MSAQDFSDWSAWKCATWFPSGIGSASPPPPATRTCDTIYASYKTGKQPTAQDYSDFAAWGCAKWFPSGIGAPVQRTCDTIYASFKAGNAPTAQDNQDWVAWKCSSYAWFSDYPAGATPPPPPATRTCDTIYASYKAGNTPSAQDKQDFAAWSCATWFKDYPTGSGAPPPPPPPPPAASGDTAYSVVAGGRSGTATTTRYWDCCKPSCGWSSNTGLGVGARSCSKSGVTLSSPNIRNGCGGGGENGPEDGNAYTCIDNQPWAVNDGLAFGFAAAPFADSEDCCACYELTFTDGPASGKKLVVQKINTGGDLSHNQFDLQIPGGGLGIFDGCSAQFGVDANTWGQRYGGVSSADGCGVLPAQLQNGCRFRFGWFKGANNPGASFRRVTCPRALVAKSACSR